jgi:3',5'-cyclic AMP phosphodiesterase CpdA
MSFNRSPPIRVGQGRNSLKILHVSDAHFGLRPRDGSRDVIQDALLDITSKLSFDVVVFSGDVGNAGTPSDYAQASAFLEFLARGKPLLLVPGNHDVDRRALTSSVLVDASASRENYLASRDKLQLLRSFQAFRTFSAPHPLDWESSLFGASLELEGFDFLAINTALLAHSDLDEGRLVVDEEFLNEALLRAYQRRRVVVVVGHHPITWLAEWNRHRVDQILQRQQRGANLYLHGHLHTAAGLAISKPTGQKLATIQAGATYQDAEWPHNFWLLELYVKEQRVKPSLYEYNADAGSFILDGRRSLPFVCDLDGAVPSEEVQGVGAMAPLPLAPRDLAFALDGRHVTWEPSGTSGQPTHIFWPVRLRQPTLIHAAQAFLAAAFQSRGVTIVLCLDSLGNVDCDVATFTRRVAKHFSLVGADWSAVRVEDAQALLTPDRLRTVWTVHAEWLARESNRLGRVLRVSKLFDPSLEGPETPLERKPRKLMTPAVIWSCFELLRVSLPKDPPAVWVTLGGWDERDLWAAWRDVFGSRDGVGHLYVPELKGLGGDDGRPLIMAEAAIHWESLEDIRRSLRRDTFPPSDGSHLLGWLLRHCFFLPKEIAGESLVILDRVVRAMGDIPSLDTCDRGALEEAVATQARDLLLG